ncbi:hypothetical protein [Hymenobacter nivis]|nr:hypothetical protein [Hymenobacter nivis]
MRRLYDSPAYAVRTAAGRVVVAPAGKARAPQLRTAAGTFQGSDHGEWGGRLVFVPRGPRARPVLVKEGNIRAVFQVQGTVYFLERDLVDFDCRGRLYEVTGQPSRLGYVLRARFAQAPVVAAVAGSDAFIAFGGGFAIVHPLLGRPARVETVLARALWAGLSPNSIAVAGPDTVYVGLRGGYARLDVAAKLAHLYQPRTGLVEVR